MSADTKSFIVRIWIESISEESDPSPTWRGVIEHVGSTERIYFHEFNTAVQFIREKADIQTDEPTPRWKNLKSKIHELRKKIPILR